MAFSGGAYSAAGKCSQLVDWYQNLHRSRHSSFSLAPAQLHARLAAQPPCIHLVSEIHCSEPWSNCILCLCVSVCVTFVLCIHLRQDSEAVENQWERQASRGLQPEGWGWTDQKPIDHHFATGKRSHKTIRTNPTQDVTWSQGNCSMPCCCVKIELLGLESGAGDELKKISDKTFQPAASGSF